MKKKSAEIAGTISALALLVLMLYASSEALSPRFSHYGFAASFVLFIAVVSVLGIRLAGMKD